MSSCFWYASSLLPPASAVKVIESEPSVCVSVCLWTLSRPNRLTYDLDFWHGSWPWPYLIWDCRSRSYVKGQGHQVNFHHAVIKLYVQHYGEMSGLIWVASWCHDVIWCHRVMSQCHMTSKCDGMVAYDITRSWISLKTQHNQSYMFVMYVCMSVHHGKRTILAKDCAWGQRGRFIKSFFMLLLL